MAAVVVVPVQAMLTSGLGLEALTTGRVVTETLGSSVGIGALARLGAAVLVLVLLRGGTAPVTSPALPVWCCWARSWSTGTPARSTRRG